jgi:hypothetical protein
VSGSAVWLHWIPLGEGASVVRGSGKVFEALVALAHRRPRRDLYHSALTVVVPGGRFTIEMTPESAQPKAERGVVAGGAVGASWLGRLRVFRYEVRVWRDGVIPDADATVNGPRLISDNPDFAQRVLGVAPFVPAPVWGRDELGAGEMWNSNSVTSWMLARAGVDVAGIALPVGGRAPGWDAGRVVAMRMPVSRGAAAASSLA